MVARTGPEPGRLSTAWSFVADVFQCGGDVLTDPRFALPGRVDPVELDQTEIGMDGSRPSMTWTRDGSALWALSITRLKSWDVGPGG